MNEWDICWVLLNEATLGISVAHGGSVGEGCSTNNKIHQPLAALTVDVKRIHPLLAFSWSLLTVTEKWNMTTLRGCESPEAIWVCTLEDKMWQVHLELLRLYRKNNGLSVIGPRVYVHVLLQESKPKIFLWPVMSKAFKDYSQGCELFYD